jgi:hypothetical protein
MADTIKITTLAQLKVALQAAKTYIDVKHCKLIYESQVGRLLS